MNTILVVIDAVVNGLWQAVAVAALVWAALKFVPRIKIPKNGTIFGVVAANMTIERSGKHDTGNTCHRGRLSRAASYWRSVRANGRRSIPDLRAVRDAQRSEAAANLRVQNVSPRIFRIGGLRSAGGRRRCINFLAVARHAPQYTDGRGYIGRWARYARLPHNLAIFLWIERVASDARRSRVRRVEAG